MAVRNTVSLVLLRFKAFTENVSSHCHIGFTNKPTERHSCGSYETSRCILYSVCSCIHQGDFLKHQIGKLKYSTYVKRTALLAVIIHEDPHFSENMSIQGLVLTLEQIYCQRQMTMRWSKSSKLHVAVHHSKILWLEMIHHSMQFISNIVLHQDNAYVWFRVSEQDLQTLPWVRKRKNIQPSGHSDNVKKRHILE